MLPRTLEPEVMDTAEEAADYDAMDHSGVNRVFVGDFVAEVRGQTSEVRGRQTNILDVGTGTALIPIELMRHIRETGDLRSDGRHGRETGRNLFVTAIDLAAEMLTLGRINVERAGFADCILLELVDAKRTPYADRTFDAVISNSIVHHIPEPRAVFAEMWRVLKPGGLLFFRDLLRPETDAEVEQIVAMYAGSESPRQQQLFRQSLHAALTVEEVAELLAQVGIVEGSPAVGNVARSADRPPRGWGHLQHRESRDRVPPCVRQTSDRHWTVIATRPA